MNLDNVKSLRVAIADAKKSGLKVAREEDLLTQLQAKVDTRKNQVTSLKPKTPNPKPGNLNPGP